MRIKVRFSVRKINNKKKKKKKSTHLLGEDVLGHKDHSGGEGEQESQGVKGDFRGAGKDDPKGEGHKRKVNPPRV